MTSLDEQVTTDLIETLEDGRKGFTSAAEKLADSDRPDLGTMFNAFAAQRAKFSSELESMAASYGDDIDESGSVVATAHRGWMAVKDALAGSDPDGVLEAAEQGETYAAKQFAEALEQEISAGLRVVVARQQSEVQRALSQISALRSAA